MLFFNLSVSFLPEIHKAHISTIICLNLCHKYILHNNKKKRHPTSELRPWGGGGVISLFVFLKTFVIMIFKQPALFIIFFLNIHQCRNALDFYYNKKCNEKTDQNIRYCKSVWRLRIDLKTLN